MKPLLIYIHGFNSSGESQKAQSVHRFVRERGLDIDTLSPTFTNLPAEAHREICQLVEEERAAGREQIALIASSLGGFMATSIAERYGLRTVLINPAVAPYELIQFLLGENVNEHTGVRYTLTEQHTEELRVLEVQNIERPDNLWVMLQTGDETLDYRKAVDFYAGCEQLVEEGGDHGFAGFEEHLPAVLEFLRLPLAA